MQKVSTKYLCAIFGTGVGVNSIQCRKWLKWYIGDQELKELGKGNNVFVQYVQNKQGCCRSLKSVNMVSDVIKVRMLCYFGHVVCTEGGV